MIMTRYAEWDVIIYALHTVQWDTMQVVYKIATINGLTQDW